MRGHIISLLLASLVVWFVFDIIWDRSPPIVVSDDYQVMNAQPVSRNDTLKVSYHVTVERACIGTGRRTVIDAAQIPLSTVPFQTDTSERSDGQRVSFDEGFDSIIEAVIPPSAAPGDATYQNQTTYFCNFWQRLLHRGIPVDFPLVNFKIGGQTLPQVAPAKAIFKKTGQGVLESWLTRQVGWLSARDDE